MEDIFEFCIYLAPLLLFYLPNNTVLENTFWTCIVYQLPSQNV